MALSFGELNLAAPNLSDVLDKWIDRATNGIAFDPVQAIPPVARKLWAREVDSEFGRMNHAAAVGRAEIDIAINYLRLHKGDPCRCATLAFRMENHLHAATPMARKALEKPQLQATKTE